MSAWKRGWMVVVILAVGCGGDPGQSKVLSAADDASPPSAPVRLVFVHHSTGGNWLADPSQDQPSGGLGQALTKNNYVVSATNYGWGPEGIGDRTDIPNWTEWFCGPNSAAVLKALYSESGQNAGDFGAWSRAGNVPAGENEIVMFKSCFPNSDLHGSPNDAPQAEPGDDLTVANAKAVYNRLLKYFATRPDKLFVVITAPPLQQGETAPDRAANARAFNNWLVNDWLKGYGQHNVAVFDYFNVLTSNAGDANKSDAGASSGNHHRWQDGAVQHLQKSDSNFCAYPSGDSHPSSAGHQKATAEFVPLLNVFYHRWKASPGAARKPAPQPKPAEAPAPVAKKPAPAPAPTPAPPPAAAAPAAGVVEDFEGECKFHCQGDQGTVNLARDTGQAHGGKASMQVKYALKAGGSGSLGRSYDTAQNWSKSSGLTLWIHAAKAGEPFTFLVFAGTPGAATPFETQVKTSPESVAGWQQISVSWKDLKLSSWADASGLKAFDPARVTGIGIGIEAPNGRTGTLWLDDVALIGGGK